MSIALRPVVLAALLVGSALAVCPAIRAGEPVVDRVAIEKQVRADLDAADSAFTAKERDWQPNYRADVGRLCSPDRDQRAEAGAYLGILVRMTDADARAGRTPPRGGWTIGGPQDVGDEIRSGLARALARAPLDPAAVEALEAALWLANEDRLDADRVAGAMAVAQVRHPEADAALEGWVTAPHPTGGVVVVALEAVAKRKLVAAAPGVRALWRTQSIAKAARTAAEALGVVDPPSFDEKQPLPAAVLRRLEEMAATVAEPIPRRDVDEGAIRLASAVRLRREWEARGDRLDRRAVGDVDAAPGHGRARVPRRHEGRDGRGGESRRERAGADRDAAGGVRAPRRGEVEGLRGPRRHGELRRAPGTVDGQPAGGAARGVVRAGRRGGRGPRPGAAAPEGPRGRGRAVRAGVRSARVARGPRHARRVHRAAVRGGAAPGPSCGGAAVRPVLGAGSREGAGGGDPAARRGRAVADAAVETAWPSCARGCRGRTDGVPGGAAAPIHDVSGTSRADQLGRPSTTCPTRSFPHGARRIGRRRSRVTG
jgi:hypothetical protein